LSLLSLTSELFVSKALVYDLLDDGIEAASVIIFTLIETKYLFVQISKSMKRLNRNVGSVLIWFLIIISVVIVNAVFGMGSHSDFGLISAILSPVINAEAVPISSSRVNNYISRPFQHILPDQVRYWTNKMFFIEILDKYVASSLGHHYRISNNVMIPMIVNKSTISAFRKINTGINMNFPSRSFSHVHYVQLNWEYKLFLSVQSLKEMRFIIHGNSYPRSLIYYCRRLHYAKLPVHIDELPIVNSRHNTADDDSQQSNHYRQNLKAVARYFMPEIGPYSTHPRMSFWNLHILIRLFIGMLCAFMGLFITVLFRPTLGLLIASISLVVIGFLLMFHTFIYIL